MKKKKRSEIDGGKKLAFKKEIQSHTVDIQKKKRRKEKIHPTKGRFAKERIKKKSRIYYSSLLHT